MYEPFKRTVYVGDTMADLIATRNAANETPRFVFVGVYTSIDSPKETLQMFLDEGADAVVPSINQLPDVLEWARSEQL
jgi:phosphoglycolate phosphatase-like HAD superfamily hydrolase